MIKAKSLKRFIYFTLITNSKYNIIRSIYFLVNVGVHYYVKNL